MTTYESDIKTISSDEEVVFGILTDLRNLAQFTDNPALKDKVKDIEYGEDFCNFGVEGFGKVGFKIIEKEAFKTIKFESVNAPVAANMWIQLKQVAPQDTRLKLTLKAEIPTMLKMMVDKKLKEGVDQLASLIAQVVNSK